MAKPTSKTAAASARAKKGWETRRKRQADPEGAERAAKLTEFNRILAETMARFAPPSRRK